MLESSMDMLRIFEAFDLVMEGDVSCGRARLTINGPRDVGRAVSCIVT